MPARKVTITDVAREAGVAVGTVSNALNHPERVRPETLELIETAIERLGYTPNQSARMLAGGNNKLFGLVIPNVNHGISLQIINGASTEASKHGFGLVIAHAGNDAADGNRYLRYFMGLQLSGILVQAPSVPDWTPASIGAHLTCPIVYLDHCGNGAGYYVAADNRMQGQLMAEHAVERGAMRLAIVGRAAAPALQLRLQGIEKVMALHPEIEFEHLDEGAGEVARDGFTLGRNLAMRPATDRPDMVIALTDALATGVIAGVQAAGLRVPGDIRVCGCDGNPLAWNGTVTLTTITPPGYEIGRKGVQCLMRQLAERAEHAGEGGTEKLGRAGASAGEVPAGGSAAASRTTNGECPSSSVAETPNAAATSAEEADAETECHQEFVRPLLLARASSSTLLDGSEAGPDLDISGYL